MTSSGSSGLFDAVPPPPKKKRRGSGLLAVVVVVVLAAVGGFVAGRLTAPATTNAAGPSPVATPVPTAGTTLSKPPATSSQASGGPSQSAASAAGVAPSGDTYLSAIKPVQANYAYGFTTGPEQIGTTSYPQSVRYTCSGGQTSVVYDVAGFGYLNATLGVPNDATNGAGNTAAVTFFKDGSTTQLGPTINDAVGQPQQVHLNLDGSAQLEIACSVTNNSTHGFVSMDIALGNGLLSVSGQ